VAPVEQRSQIIVLIYKTYLQKVSWGSQGTGERAYCFSVLCPTLHLLLKLFIYRTGWLLTHSLAEWGLEEETFQDLTTLQDRAFFQNELCPTHFFSFYLCYHLLVHTENIFSYLSIDPVSIMGSFLRVFASC
jgi:hypothetical protein